MILPKWQNILLRIQQLTFDIKQQQAFLEDIASLMEDGVQLKQALETAVQLNKGPEQTLSEAMLKQLAEGKHVADAMTGWYPDPVVEIIRAGEDGGILVQTLRAASASLTKREGVFSSLINMMIYPVTVIFMAIGVAIFINHSIFSTFRQLTPLDRWPDDAQTLAAIASFMQNWWWVILLTLIIAVYLFVLFLRDYVGDLRAWLDKLPVWSLYRKMNAARLMETLGLLIANGLVLKRALKVMQNRASPYLGVHLLLMEHRLGAGRDNIADVLDTGLIGEEDLSRLRMIAQSKGFEHALVRQGQYALDKGNKSVKTTGRIVSGIMLAAAALFIMFMVTSVYSAGFSVVPSY